MKSWASEEQAVNLYLSSTKYLQSFAIGLTLQFGSLILALACDLMFLGAMFKD